MRSFVQMPSDEYHAHKAIGSTTLKLGLQSMAKIKAKVDGRIREKSTDYFDLGKAAHSAVLERDFDNYVCGPDADKRTKEWKEFEAANAGKLVLKEPQYLQVKGMYEAFYSHTLASKIVQGGKPESSFFVEILGQEYKARPDYTVVEGSERGDKSAYLVDYKTCETLEYDFCQRAVANYGYDVSAAHYIKVFSATTEIPVTEYYWIFQEKEAPYEIAVFRADDECRERAMRLVNRLYEKVSACNKSGLWPSRFNSQIYDMDLPHFLAEKRSIE